MKTRDLKSLSETIASVVDPIDKERAQMLQEGFLNSLTEKARQIASKEMEDEGEEEEDEDEMDEAYQKYPNIKKPNNAPHGSDPGLKRRRERDMETIGHGKPTTSPYKVKKFKTKFDTNTIYGEEQLGEAVSAKRMRIIRKYVKGNKRVPEHLKDYMERSFKKKRFKDAKLSDGRGAVGALETRMRRKSAALRARGVEPKGVAPGYLEEEWGGGFQSSQDAQRQVQAGLRSDAARERRTKINDIKAVLAGKMTKNAFTKKHRTKFSEHPLTKKIVAAREKAKSSYLAKKTAKGLSEDTLDEGILKKLRRAKGAAYAAMQKGEGDKYAKLHGVASGLESRYKASMARRGGATPETVKGAGSRLSKRGKYTLKAGKLATQHDKATRSFRSMAGVKELINKGEDKSEKRSRQQAQAKFANKARSGDFGQNNQEGLRAKSNFEKRYGRLKGK